MKMFPPRFPPIPEEFTGATIFAAPIIDLTTRSGARNGVGCSAISFSNQSSGILFINARQGDGVLIRIPVPPGTHPPTPMRGVWTSLERVHPDGDTSNSALVKAFCEWNLP
jgi:hypothetical protein